MLVVLPWVVQQAVQRLVLEKVLAGLSLFVFVLEYRPLFSLKRPMLVARLWQLRVPPAKPQKRVASALALAFGRVPGWPPPHL
mmetsp:Transcript_14461/g.42212  ORF Transcript_14461/g.42212 Transcript_14461/m.42212 type:complete len:83 (-) Transcript_14461:2428-2676(-)